MKRIIHVLSNAHLDPVWLWDWREGLNEGIATCRSVLKLMREFPQLTFSKGECSVYEAIESYAPETFREIQERVAEGRWELVGGNVVQPDTNLCSTEALLRQYRYGRAYFREKFGVEVETAWAPDSFGHAAGFPAIYADSGFRYFCFTRFLKPLSPNLEYPLFRWCAPGGKSILTLFDAGNRCYATWAREVAPRMLDNLHKRFQDSPLRNVPFFLGLGDHGGGPTRRLVEDVLAWAKEHAEEYEVKFSTFHNYFEAVLAERPEIPEYTGELNFCLRGCTASGLRVKAAYRRAEAELLSAERVDEAVSKKLGTPPVSKDKLWKNLIFNTFHDILPGSAIYRALNEQQEWLNGIRHESRAIAFRAMNRLAQNLPIRVPVPSHFDLPEAKPILVFNPRNAAYRAEVELECALDYRPIPGTEGQHLTIPVELLDEAQNPIPYQLIATECDYITKMVWRARLVARLDLPACGHRLLTMGYVPEGARIARVEDSPVRALDDHGITNGRLALSVEPGDSRIRITRDGKPVLAQDGLEFALFQDPFGSWGAMDEDPAGWRADVRLETWKATQVRVVEAGPERAVLFAVFTGGDSSVRVRFALERGGERVVMACQLLWQHRGDRLKLVMGPSKKVVYQVSGGTVEREVLGDVHCGQWQKLDSGWGVANDVICSSAQLEDSFSFTIVRGCLAACEQIGRTESAPERPAIDSGAHDFTFVFAPAAQIEAEADALVYRPVVTIPWTHD